MHRGIIGRSGLPLTHNGSYIGSPLFDVTELDIKSPTVDGDLESYSVWNDGSRLFWKDSYEFDFNTSTWKKKRFTFPPYQLSQYDSTGISRYIWSDGSNIYFSGGRYTVGIQKVRQFVLVGDTWENKTWHHVYSDSTVTDDVNIAGCNIWTDGDNIYHSPYSGTHYILDKQTSTWYPVEFTINASGQYSTKGECIWTDGTNIYATYLGSSLILDKQNREWNPVSFTGTSPNTDGIWHTASNTYYSNFSGQSYRLNVSTREWTLMDWDLDIGYYQHTLPWVFGGRVHTSANGGYDLDPTETTWVKSETIKHDVLIDSLNMWTDGKGLYLSDGTNNYKYDKNENALIDTGIETHIDGSGVWSDGVNTYYSGNSQLQWNPTTSTWTEKTWNGNAPLSGVYIWTDGENIYHTNNGRTDILDKSTSTWSEHQWASDSYNPRSGRDIWKQGDHVFYSTNTYGENYEFDITENKWNHVDIKWYDWKDSPKVINGYNVFVLNGHSYSSDWLSLEELQTSRMRWTMILPYEHGFDDTRIIMGQWVFVAGKEAYYFYGSTQLLIK